MANVSFYQAATMSTPFVWYGDITTATSSTITITGNSGRSETYTGSFSYDYYGYLAGGTVTSYISYVNYSLDFTISGASLNALTVNAYLDAGNAVGLFRYAVNGNDVIIGSGVADDIIGFSGDDSIYGGSGNDYLDGGSGNDYLDGGLGIDTVAFNIKQSAVTEVRHLKTGGAVISSSEGSDTLINIEKLSFNDGSLSIDALIASRPIPIFISKDNNGNSSTVTPTLYTGPVAFLEYELFGTVAGDVFFGSTSNDFMSLSGGDDAANGGLGDDVLDGGTGSNFLTGGGDNDTLFLDGRKGITTWSTVTDFNAGDEVNIWGWSDGTSELLLTQESNGATGFTGATFHYDLDNNGSIDTSITFTGLAIADIPAASPLSVAGNGYLLIG